MQQAFVKAYIKCGNGEEAAEKAGYSQPRVAAWELLRNVRVSQVIAMMAVPRMARTAHVVSDLIDAQLRAWTELVAADPMAAADLPTKELRGLLALTLEKLIPPISQPYGSSVGPNAPSVAELTAQLEQAEALAARYAKVVNPGETGDSPPNLPE